jgi:SAM-dependent methyltransferase
MIKHAELRLQSVGGEAELHVQDLSQPLDFLRDGSVDGILAPLVLHYLRDWGPTLKEFLRVLRPEGWFVMSTHHPTTEAMRFDVPNYFAVELLEDYWSWVGTVKFYRRPLSAITGALVSAGFVIETLAEPLPDETFRTEKPDAYQRILKHPDFLMIRAKKIA